MASSIDNAFITQYGRRKPKMPQKRNRVRKVGIVPVPVPKDEDKTGFLNKLDEDLKRLKPYKPKPKPKAKPKPPKRGDKKYKVEKPIYRGESLSKSKSSQEV